MTPVKQFFLIAFALILSLFESPARNKQWKGKPVNFSFGKLIVSLNQRFIIHENGKPFFYLADTAWELFQRLDETEIDVYFENRRAKGFTVIQAVILCELDSLGAPNRNGDRALIDNNPDLPNENYFNWIDKVLRKAQNKGVFMALVPTWGDKVDKQWGAGPVIFTEENAFRYGRFLGKRYKDFPNIIWMNGGDRSGGGSNFAIWDALAKGIKSEDRNHLMTFHPKGEESSSSWFQNSEWCDFNVCQTSHSQTGFEIYRRLLVRDYNLNPAKPCMDAEPRYEDIPIDFKPEKGWFDDADVRNSLYWSLFSGGFGYTYGCNNIWQFYTKDKKPICSARKTWQESLDLPGAFDLIYARKLLESVDFLSRIPDQSIIISSQDIDRETAVASRGKDYAFVYLPTGNDTEVSLEKIPNSRLLRLDWFNPRTGKTKKIKNIKAAGTFRVKPPSGGRGNDWLLIMKKIY